MLASIIAYFLRNSAGRICPSLRHSVCCVPFDSQRQPWSTSWNPQHRTELTANLKQPHDQGQQYIKYGVKVMLSQFQLCPAAPPSPPPPGYCGAFARLASPGGGAFVLRRPGPGIFCYLRGHSRDYDTHAVSYQNITTQKVLQEKKQTGSSVQDKNK